MPNKCTICARPDYNEVIDLIRRGQSINSVSVRYSISYDSLRRCFREHTVFDEHDKIMQEIKENEKSLAALRKAKVPEGSIEVERIKKYLKGLRDELRTVKDRRGTSGHSVRVDDPQTWPDWLPGFMTDWFDACVAAGEAERLKTWALERACSLSKDRDNVHGKVQGIGTNKLERYSQNVTSSSKTN